MNYLVKPPTAPMRVSIDLPASKSISNRVLIMRALSGEDFPIENLSDCDDTRVMQESLQNLPEIIDVGAAGTSMRFLTAYLAQLEGQEHVITGSERMKKRPIKILVDALRTLGADIEYLGEEGFPPLRIRGRKLSGDKPLTMDGSVSSQYISAIMMIAPLMEGGLQLFLDGEVASRPYIDMTLLMMKRLGISARWSDDYFIKIKPGHYHCGLKKFVVEPDWSAAAFWMEIVALRGVKWADEIRFPGLKTDSVQGDATARWIFSDLQCHYTDRSDPGTKDSYILADSRQMQRPNYMLDFSRCPDLAQAVVVTCCLKDIPFLFVGLESLHIKETDRIAALKRELKKLGYAIHGGRDEEAGVLMWQRGQCTKQKLPVIDTYQDHRMAMAFAPCCIKLGEIRIAHPEVVSKSYPRFWDDLRMAGFTIEEAEE